MTGPVASVWVSAVFQLAAPGRGALFQFDPASTLVMATWPTPDSSTRLLLSRTGVAPSNTVLMVRAPAGETPFEMEVTAIWTPLRRGGSGSPWGAWSWKRTTVMMTARSWASLRPSCNQAGSLGASFPPPGGLAEYVSGCGPGMTGRGRKGGGRLARAAVDAGHGGGVIVLPGDEDGRCERRLGKRDRGARLALHGT